MTQKFTYDVFVSHSAKDKAIALDIASRLAKDGLKVWFDDWEIQLGDSIPLKIEQGLESARTFVLCMSENAFSSDWVSLEIQSFRFRDPVNKYRRFIPLRLDSVEPKGLISHFQYLDWRNSSEDAYKKLFEICKPTIPEEEKWRSNSFRSHLNFLSNRGFISNVAFKGSDRALTGSWDSSIKVWDIDSGFCLGTLEAHHARVNSVAYSADYKYIVSGSSDNTARVWDCDSQLCLRKFEGHSAPLTSATFSYSTEYILTASEDKTLRIWSTKNSECLRVLEGHIGAITSAIFSFDDQLVLSGSMDNTARIWNVKNGHCLFTLDGHSEGVTSIAISNDSRFFLTGSKDRTLRIWDVMRGRCIGILEGHTEEITSFSISEDNSLAISGSKDATLRLWNVRSGKCLQVLIGHQDRVRSVQFFGSDRYAISSDFKGEIHLWSLDGISDLPISESTSLDYTNAKVLLVGDSAAGKTGLAQRIALNIWEKSDSTVGAWSTQWKLPQVQGNVEVGEREIWLWDFGGQADQRLIHQLFMDETALAVLVFDPQKEDYLDRLAQWNRDIDKAKQRPLNKLLVAARLDAGGLRGSRSSIDKFVSENGFSKYLETSAKENIGCEELRTAIVESICWEDLPWRSSPVLFKKLKEAIVRLKDSGQVMLRFTELRQRLELELGADDRFADADLQAVIGLLSGPGVLCDLRFGAFVLMQP